MALRNEWHRGGERGWHKKLLSAHLQVTAKYMLITTQMWQNIHRPTTKALYFLLLQNKKGRKVGGIHYLYVCAVDRRKNSISDRVLYKPDSTFWWWKGTSVWFRVIIDQILLIETTILQKLWCSVCDCGRKGAPKHVLVLLKCGSTIGCDCHRRVQYLVIRASMFLFRFDSIPLMIFCWKDRFPMKDKLNTPFVFERAWL